MSISPSNYAPAWLDSMYNNRALVPDHADYFARWAFQSSLARQSPHCHIDLRYGESAGEQLDVFPATGGRDSGAPASPSATSPRSSGPTATSTRSTTS